MKDSDERKLSHEVAELAGEVHQVHLAIERGLEWLKSHSSLATKQDLELLGIKIMSQISDYTGRVDAAFDAIGANVDGAVTGLTGLTKDVADLKDIILKLQSNPGTITPEDQALLDAGEAKVNALVTKTAALKDALVALDAQTENPPPAPV